MIVKVKIILFLILLKMIYDIYNTMSYNIIDRKTKKKINIKKTIFKSILICIVYKWNFLGEFNPIINFLIKKIKLYYNSKNIPFKKLNQDPKIEILKFCKLNNIQINPWIWEKNINEYISINDFFARKFKYPLPNIQYKNNDNIITSPCECKILVFNNVKKMKQIWVKNTKFKLKNIGLNDYINGSIAICRLSLNNYHIYHMPIDGTIINIKSNNKTYSHSVIPVVLHNNNFNIFNNNVLKFLEIYNKNIGIFTIMIVGGLGIDSINLNNNIKINSYLKKGEDIGEFKYGGSCVVLFFKNNIVWDEDLRKFSNNNNEVSINIGEKIGKI